MQICNFIIQVSMLLVPTCYGLLMTLTIRGCMGDGGPKGILALLAPDWTHITQPWVWLEAAKFVFISLQLGLGVISTYASFNKYHHNIIRYELLTVQMSHSPHILKIQIDTKILELSSTTSIVLLCKQYFELKMSVWKHGRVQMCIIWQHQEQNNDFQFSKLSVSLFTSVLNGANHLSPRGYCTVFEMVRCRY